MIFMAYDFKKINKIRKTKWLMRISSENKAFFLEVSVHSCEIDVITSR